MNSRDYKVFAPGHYYHVFNRGNNKQPIFLDDKDYYAFLFRLKKSLALPVSKGIFDTRVRITPMQAGSVDVLAYCLMPNHFHFLFRQNTGDGIDKIIHRVATSYVKYVNLKYNRVGNLFQDSFKAKLVDTDEYAKYVSAYIHTNPAEPFSYRYSSLLDYVGSRSGSICTQSIILKWFNNNSSEYIRFIQSLAPDALSNIINNVFDD